ncbi:MAG: ABC transporter ATP-binding protein [Actinobacteria bacterium]|nr:ABC transporter ATP-binding protein [Actinomycetota bacterium]
MSARGLTKHFGAAVALDGLDLEVARGEVFGFVGPNGAGKTTTIRLLLDLLRPTGGSLSVLGLDPRHDGPTLRRRVGYLPGDLNLPARLTGRQLLGDHAAVRGVDLGGRVDELAERFDADLDRSMGELSLGNRRKIGVIDAFAHRPDLLVLDEPTGGLDPLVQQEFRALVREAADEGRTVFLSSHVLDEVQHTADRVAVLRAGRLVVEDRVDALLARLRRAVTVRFSTAPSPQAFATVPGVVSVQAVEPDGVRFELEGVAGPLLAAIAPYGPLDLHATEPDLEDAFLGFYGGGRG